MSLVVKVMQAATGLAIAIIIARLLGVEAFGHYAAMVALVQLTIIPVQSGTAGVLRRQVTSCVANQRFEELKGLLVWGALTSLVYAVILAVLLILFDTLAIIGISEYSIIAISVAMMCGRLSSAVIAGLKYVVLAQAFDLFKNILLLIFIVAMFFTGNVILEKLVLSYAVAAIIVSLSMAIISIKLTPFRPLTYTAKYYGTNWFKTAGTFILIGGLFKVNDQIGILLIRHISSAYEAGLYQAAFQLSSAMLLGSTAISMTVMPHFTHFKEKSRTSSLQKLATKSSQAAFLFSLSGVILFYAFGNPIVSTLYGAQYIGSLNILITISIGYLINSSTGASAVLLSATGHQLKLLPIAAITLFINIASAAVLIPLYGGVGAAIAMVLALSVSNWLLREACINHVSIDPLFISVKYFGANSSAPK